MGIVKKLTPFERLYPYAADVLEVVRAMAGFSFGGAIGIQHEDIILKARALVGVISDGIGEAMKCPYRFTLPNSAHHYCVGAKCLAYEVKSIHPNTAHTFRPYCHLLRIWLPEKEPKP